jgi:glycerate dehydrogenase
MNKISITFLDAYTNNPGDLSFDMFSGLGVFSVYDRTNLDELHERAGNADVVIVNKFKINAESLSLMPKVKYICVAATGINNIDIEACAALGIQVSNVHGYSNNSVAQHVFACILSLTNRPEYYIKEVVNGRWSSNPDFCFYDHTIEELAGKTIGIYGFGAIGQKIAKIAFGFDMEVISVVRNSMKDKPDYVTFVDHDTLMSQSDYVSLHCPLTEETKELINIDNLQKMKPTSILINTGRGGLVNENDLKQALDHNIIKGAILDVLQAEPPSQQHPLINHPKCMITPHQAWASKESRQRLLDGVARNIKAWLWENQQK